MAQPALEPLRDRLRQRLRWAAAAYAADRLSVSALARLVRDELHVALGGALLIGAGGRRGGLVDAALRDVLAAADDDLTALVQQLAAGDRDLSLTQRLAAFEDWLDDAYRAGVTAAAETPRTTPLVPLAAAGSALAALLLAARRSRRGAAAVTLPRLDSREASAMTARWSAQLDDLAVRLARGDLSLADWHRAMADALLNLHRDAYALGAGGQLDARQQARLTERVRQQLDYLAAWRDDLAQADGFSEAAMRGRARLYLNAANATLQDARASTVRGLPPLPAYPGDGTTRCLTNCRCSWRIVRLPEPNAYDCYWRLGVAEHCPTCLARAAAWQPIRARDGAWLPFDTADTFHI